MLDFEIPQNFTLILIKVEDCSRIQCDWEVILNLPPTFAGEPTLLVSLRQPGAERDIQTQKERMPTFVDILFALQVGLEPTTP